jgi:hypothetical protein
MTNDDAGLSQTEAAQWSAIVASEWPGESAILTTQLSSGSASVSEPGRTAGQGFATVFQPRRPRLTPLAVGVSALAATAWLTIRLLIPAYQGAGLADISRSARAVEVHDLPIAAALVAISLVVAASCVGTWAVFAARYLLRRSSCRLVASHSTPPAACVRPPNPAAAAAWILLLLTASTAAGWWILMQLGRTSGSPVRAVEALHLAAMGGVAWLAVFLLCAIGLTVWVARESRHQLRCTASHRAAPSCGGAARSDEN